MFNRKNPETVLTDFESRFDRLNTDETHHQNRNDICTPMGCVHEMVNSIPDWFWKKKNLGILDPCAGNGNFHACIQGRVPLKNLVFNEINEQRITNIRKLFGEGARITRMDFLEYDEDRKYDLIVSNPPYAMFTNGIRTAKNHNMSRAFIQKALRLMKPDGFILFIVPNNWMSCSDRNTLPSELSRYQFHHLNIHGAKTWFPKVGSSFTWFLLQKSANRKPFTVENNYVFRNTVQASLPIGMDYIPLHYTDTVKEIFLKTIQNEGKKQGIETSSNLHKYTKKAFLSENPSEEFCHRVIHTPIQTVWSSKEHKYQNGWKVFLSLTNTYQTFVDNCGMTQSIAFIRCASKREAMQKKEELDSPVFRFLNDMTRYGNFNNIRIMQRFPQLKDVRLTSGEQKLVNQYWSQND